MTGDQELFEGLPDPDGFGAVLIGERRKDGEIVGTIAAEVADGVATFDEDDQEAAGVGTIQGQEAAELGQGTGTGGSQGDEGIFLARGEIGEGEDGVLLEEGVEIGFTLPVGGIVEGVVEGVRRREAGLQTALDTDGEQVPGAVEVVEMGGGKALEKGEEDVGGEHVKPPR